MLIAWWRRDRLLPEATTFVGVALLLFGLRALGSIALTGSPFGPYQVDLWLGGLVGPQAAKFNAITWERFLTYPRVFFLRDRLGDLLYAVYPHLLVLFALLAWPLGLRSSKEVWAWFLAVFLAMQFQMLRVEGVWVTMFRNIRHSHPMVYPMVLLLAGYFVSLRTRHPRLAYGLLAGVLLYGAWTSVSVASKTRDAFGDARSAARYVAALPRKPIYAEIQLVWSFLLPDAPADVLVHELESDPAKRRAQIAAVRDGYLVTGGGREPYYGCDDCIGGADELQPGRWRLLKEFPGPARPTPQRREPARVWEAVPATP